MSNQQAVDFVIEHLKAGIPAPQICERMLDHCLMKNSKVCLLPVAPAVSCVGLARVSLVTTVYARHRVARYAK